MRFNSRKDIVGSHSSPLNIGRHSIVKSVFCGWGCAWYSEEGLELRSLQGSYGARLLWSLASYVAHSHNASRISVVGDLHTNLAVYLRTPSITVPGSKHVRLEVTLRDPTRGTALINGILVLEG
jgi:hypothetical protein